MTICDRCKRHEGRVGHYRVHFISMEPFRLTGTGLSTVPTLMGADLCPDCVQVVSDTVRAAIERELRMPGPIG